MTLRCEPTPLRVAGGLVSDPYVVAATGSAGFGAATDPAAGILELQEWGRYYLATSCNGPWPSSYTAWQMIGRTLAFTVSLAAAGCGCNLAVYTGAMQQNQQIGECSGGQSGLHYCDANNVCGVRCDELDLMEANNRAFHSVAHRYDDGSGRGGGFGGVHGNPGSNYGPGRGNTIDTSRAFRVATKFEGYADGSLSTITTTLTQGGSSVLWSMAPAWYLHDVSASTQAGCARITTSPPHSVPSKTCRYRCVHSTSLPASAASLAPCHGVSRCASLMACHQ